MGEKIVFERLLTANEIEEVLKKIEFRGLYDKKGNPLHPYKNARFSLVCVHPPKRATSFPQLMNNMQPQPLFSAQPTIYEDKITRLKGIDKFLKTIDKSIAELKFEGVQFCVEGKGTFHIIPPVVEKHAYQLNKGFFDIDKLLEKFTGTFVKDANGNLHELSKKVLRNFYIDETNCISYLDTFNHNVELLNYGLGFNQVQEFYIICDGSHRMDYALEYNQKPINVILVEGEELLPYYSFPLPFRPTTRLSSKRAEKKYPGLAHDKVHLLNNFIRKSLLYNWEAGGLHISSLRTRERIY